MALQPPPYQDIDRLATPLQLWFNQIKQQVNSGSGTIAWSTVSKTGANLTDIPTRNHNDLLNIFGGAAADYYHMKQSEYVSVTALNTITTSTTLVTTTHGYVLCDATSGAITVTLSSAGTRKRYHIKKIDSSANAITISRAGSDTFEGGGTSLTISTQFKSYTIYSDGVSKWYIETST